MRNLRSKAFKDPWPYPSVYESQIVADFPESEKEKEKEKYFGKFCFSVSLIIKGLFLRVAVPSNKNKEQRIWERYVSGEDSAMEELVTCCHNELTLFLLKRLKNKDLTKDVLQDTWLKMLKTRKPIKNIKAYIYTVAKNTCKNYHSKHFTNSDINFAEATLKESPAVEKKYGFRHLYRKMKLKLTKKEAKVVIDTMNGYNNKEIAKELEVSEKRVYNMKSIIKNKLRK